jgi:glutaconate CoA-transferase subunit A
VTYGGPDVGLLCNAGKVKRLVYGFVSLDSIALEPHFRKARQAGSIQAAELDEGMLQWGLLAASHKLPFLPTRAGLGSDVLAINPEIRMVQSPYEDGEQLVAMPALELDVAFIHMNRGDVRGNGQYLGPDPYFDDIYCRAAKQRFMTVEKILTTAEMANEGPLQSRIINRTMVDGVIEAPRGAHFTECPPDYGRDEAFQKKYAATAKDEDAWLDFKKTYLDLENEAEYQRAVRKT